jgi:predicted PurR-regulated permease PerM
MSYIKRWYVWLPFLALVFVFFYFFSVILIYIFTALIISLMGNPIVRMLDKVHIWKIRLPHSFNALIALLVVVGIFSALFYFLIPVLVDQAQYISQVDIYGILNNLKEPINHLEDQLREYHILSPTDTFEGIISTYVLDFLASINIQKFAGGLFGMLGQISIGVFSILFLAFFFLRDDRLVYKGLKTITPNESHDEIARILFYSKKMLSRYFIGLFIEQITMMTLISVGMYIVGLPNAIFIGIAAGIFNIIPYLGPIIGGIVGSIIGLTALPSDLFATDAFPLLLQMLAVFGIANLIDNFVLQPVIYSRSVKAHPIEIFLVVIMAGMIAGPFGMILAIPAYTLIRIIAMEFFKNWSFVSKATQSLGAELQRTRESKEAKEKDK